MRVRGKWTEEGGGQGREDEKGKGRQRILRGDHHLLLVAFLRRPNILTGTTASERPEGLFLRPSLFDTRAVAITI